MPDLLVKLQLYLRVSVCAVVPTDIALHPRFRGQLTFKIQGIDISFSCWKFIFGLDPCSATVWILYPPPQGEITFVTNQVATQVPLVLKDSVTPWVVTLQEVITLCVNGVLGLQVIRIVELVWKCLFTDVAGN